MASTERSFAPAGTLAVERDTPALTVGAGRMSQPILERLGFIAVGWIDCLLDRFG